MVKTKRQPEQLPAKLLRAASSGSGIRLSNGEVRRLLLQFPDVEHAGREAAGDSGGLAPGVGPQPAGLPAVEPYNGPQLVRSLRDWAGHMQRAAEAVAGLDAEVAAGNRTVAQLLQQAAQLLDRDMPEQCEGCAGDGRAVPATHRSADDVPLCKECFDACDVVEPHDEPRILNLGAALAASTAMQTAKNVAAAEEESW